MTTQYTLSIATLREHNACDIDARIADICDTLGREVPEDEGIPLRVWWGLKTTSVSDMWWSLRCLGEPGRRLCVEASCLAARRVLPLTREQDRPVCLAAIESAEGWLRGEVTRMECRRAADAAYAAVANAYAAAYAAVANAYAAYAADANAIAYAAAAAEHAAAAAADAASEREQQRLDLYRLVAFGSTL